MSRLTENLKRLEEMGKLNKHHMGILENSLEEHDKEIRNKAIDEFAEKIKKKGIEDNWNCNDFYGDSCGVTSCEECENDFLREIDEIAEQMKGGAV